MSEWNWLDGNGVAGELDAAFGIEMTSVMRACSSCGTAAPIGAHRAYIGMGIVLRCPKCEDVAVTVVTLADRHVVQMRGAMRLELPLGS
jgi:Zn finger protein HypA/HybF involved in hydrogenase expression